MARPTHGLAGFLYAVGHAMQRVSLLMLLAVLLGVPLAILLPNHPGLVLVAGLYLAVVVRVARRRS